MTGMRSGQSFVRRLKIRPPRDDHQFLRAALRRGRTNTVCGLCFSPAGDEFPRGSFILIWTGFYEC
jgi:hypothetical protein